MIKVFYIEDNNGQYVSADGSKRWTRLTGQALYDFLRTERGKKTYFFVDTDDNGVAIGVEITNKDQQAMLETDKRRRRYVSESQKESGYITSRRSSSSASSLSIITSSATCNSDCSSSREMPPSRFRLLETLIAWLRAMTHR